MAPKITGDLRTLGFQTIGELANTARAPLPLRFGPEIGRRLDQMFGRASEPIDQIRTEDLIEALQTKGLGVRIVLVRQKPGSAKRVMFITIEDETGPANIVVWPSRFEKRRRIVLGSSMMAINGRIQREGEVVHLVAQQRFDLTTDLSGLADRDVPFKLEAGRGDEFADGGGPDPRDAPRSVPRPKEMFDPDLRIEALKVKSRNFQ